MRRSVYIRSKTSVLRTRIFWASTSSITICSPVPAAASGAAGAVALETGGTTSVIAGAVTSSGEGTLPAALAGGGAGFARFFLGFRLSDILVFLPLNFQDLF